MGTDLSGAAPLSGRPIRAPRLVLRVAGDLIRNIAAGLRLALFLPVRRWRFRSSTAQAFLLLVVSFAISMGHDFAATWPDNELNPDGLVFEAAMNFLFVISIALIAAAEDRPERALMLAVCVLSISPTGFVVYTLLYELAIRQPLLDVAMAVQGALAIYLAWYLAAAARAIRLVLRPVMARGAVLLLFYGACNIIPWFLLPGAPLWQPAAAAASAPAARAAPDIEDLLLRQSGLLQDQLAALLPQRPGVIDVYFLGVAGDGAEEVFLNEAGHAKRVFGDRFDARGRALLLANHQRTQDVLPIAAGRTIAGAIEGIAQKMDRAEDVLVVFLTSHGGEDGSLALDLGFRSLAPLAPADLRAALDAAGVEWRVVIASACFSGGFVEALRGDRALAISAARTDRNSFGCGHDGDYTYFGRAFIGEELPRAESIEAAFEGARRSVDAREKSEGRVPSEPQIAVGREIRLRLEALAGELSWRRREAPSDTVRGFEVRAGEPAPAGRG